MIESLSSAELEKKSEKVAISDKIFWTPERISTLKDLWAEGLSASQIAKFFGSAITRNAVIGKVHRLGISAREGRGKKTSSRFSELHEANTPSTRSKTDENGKKTSDKTPPHGTARIVSLPINGRTQEPCTLLMLTEKTCRWPLGDPGTKEFRFCGCTSLDSRPYCPSHTRLAYQTIQSKRSFKLARGA